MGVKLVTVLVSRWLVRLSRSIVYCLAVSIVLNRLDVGLIRLIILFGLLLVIVIDDMASFIGLCGAHAV